MQTLPRRLEKKGHLRHQTQGKAHAFTPATRREDVITRSVDDFPGRLFGGVPIPLMHYLAEHGKITAKDIEILKRLIESAQSLDNRWNGCYCANRAQQQAREAVRRKD